MKKMMKCERCDREVERKSSNQKYCFMCSTSVAKESTRLRKKNKDKLNKK